MKIKSRELNIANLITKSYEKLITKQLLNFNNFIIIINNFIIIINNFIIINNNNTLNNIIILRINQIK